MFVEWKKDVFEFFLRNLRWNFSFYFLFFNFAFYQQSNQGSSIIFQQLGLEGLDYYFTSSRTRGNKKGVSYTVPLSLIPVLSDVIPEYMADDPCFVFSSPPTFPFVFMTTSSIFRVYKRLTVRNL